MADIETKKINDLEENSSILQTDNVMVGYNDTNTLRRISFKNILQSIKENIQSWTFSNLNTSDQTLPGAINEVRSSLNSNVSTINSSISTINSNLSSLIKNIEFTSSSATISAYGSGTFKSSSTLTESGYTRLVIVDASVTGTNEAACNPYSTWIQDNYAYAYVGNIGSSSATVSVVFRVLFTKNI